MRDEKYFNVKKNSDIKITKWNNVCIGKKSEVKRQNEIL